MWLPKINLGCVVVVFLLLIGGKHPGKITFSFSAAPVRGTPGPQPILEGLSLKGIHGADSALATHRVSNAARGWGHTDASVSEGSLPLLVRPRETRSHAALLIPWKDTGTWGSSPPCVSPCHMDPRGGGLTGGSRGSLKISPYL